MEVDDVGLDLVHCCFPLGHFLKLFFVESLLIVVEMVLSFLCAAHVIEESAVFLVPVGFLVLQAVALLRSFHNSGIRASWGELGGEG